MEVRITNHEINLISKFLVEMLKFLTAGKWGMWDARALTIKKSSWNFSDSVTGNLLSKLDTCLSREFSKGISPDSKNNRYEKINLKLSHLITSIPWRIHKPVKNHKMKQSCSEWSEIRARPQLTEKKNTTLLFIPSIFSS